MSSLNNKVVWITGASSGIGEAMAISASRQGARLVMSARRETELQRVRNACAEPSNVAVLPLDLSSFDANAAVAQAASFFGPIDVLVNNAGISQRSLVIDTELAVYRRIMELDYFAVVALTRAVLPGMIARKSGHIVTISSVAGKVATPLRSGYAAAKHALHGFHDALRAEVHDANVKVTVACPGFIRTQISVNAVTGDGAAQNRMDAAQAAGMEPMDCADRIWSGVRKGKSEIIVGGRETLTIALKRLSPKLVETLVRQVPVT